MLTLPQWVLGQQLWTLGHAGRYRLSQRAPISPVSWTWSALPGADTPRSPVQRVGEA